jgi:Zn-dependent peptidase ImmA (M78 family)
MGIIVEPFANLTRDYKVDALPVFADDSIRIDEEAYNSPEHWFGRLRFTLMHELAHFILHKEHLANRNFKTMSEWAQFVRKVERERSIIEEQANEFAGRFLMPVDRLRLMIPEERDKLLDIHGTISQFDLIRFTAVRLGKKFNVSPTAIKVRIRKEKLQSMFWKNASAPE